MSNYIISVSASIIMPKSLSKCKIEVLKIMCVKRSPYYGAWALVEFKSGQVIEKCTGKFNCEKDMIVVGQMYSGNLYRKEYKGKMQWCFDGKPSNRLNHMFKYQLHRASVNERIRKILFDTFSVKKLFNILENKRWNQLTSLPGIGRKVVKNIEKAYDSYKKCTDKSKKLFDEFPNFCEILTQEHKEALNEWLGEQNKIIDFLRDDPYKIVYDNEFSSLDCCHSRAKFLKATKQKTRINMAEAAAKDLNLSHDYIGRKRYLAIDAVNKYIKGTGNYWMPMAIFSLKINQYEENWPFVEHRNHITLQKYNEIERTLERIFEEIYFTPKMQNNITISSEILDEHQCKAVTMACEKPLFILQGGAGVGKTTTCKEIVKCLDNKVTCAAPTGKAAQRLQELTGIEAYTTHRLFHSNSIKVHPNILLDEQSMQEPEILAKMLNKYMKCKNIQDERNCNSGLEICKIIFVGDIGQLTSVGPGQFFKDICSSNIPSVELTHIYRSGPDSFIASNGQKIRNGDIFLDTSPESFEIIPFENDKVIIDKVIEIHKNTNVAPMVLCNTNKEVANLNPLLRKYFNDIDSRGKHEKSPPINLGFISSQNSFLYPDYIFAVGDKVQNIKNKYEQSDLDDGQSLVTLTVANGDVGVIVGISKHVTVDETGKNVTINQIRVGFDYSGYITYSGVNEFNEYLRPAYALTVNKAQGSEYSHVIYKACYTFGDNHERFYTGESRGKQKCTIYEVNGAIEKCIKAKKSYRKTFLCRDGWSLTCN